MNKATKRAGALVLGGGVAGMEVALSLAAAGVEVVLAEKSPSIGGGMARLDKTFPTDDCAMCILAPRMLNIARHELIEIVTNAELISLEGQEGNFTARLMRTPRMVAEERCIACLDCVKECPVRVPDPFDFGLGETKCIHQPFPQAVPPAPVIERGSCLYHQKGGVCHKCEKACPASAISLDERPRPVTVEVSCVVAATGFGPVAGGGELPPALSALGHGRIKDVVTSLEFERILSPTGPTGGRVERPSDGRTPESLAFVLCSGFRDPHHGFAHCGAVCCLFAAKEAVAAGERGIKSATVFYTDLREGGKGFHRYIKRARESYHVELVRARVSEAREDRGRVSLSYMDPAGDLAARSFDMAVLAAGPAPSKKTGELARRLGVEMDELGYLRVSPEDRVSTTRKGVFAVGCAAGPGDIPEAVLSGSAAAARSLMLIPGDARRPAAQALPTEKGPAEEERVGVFLCRCGVNIGSVLDLEAMAEATEKMEGVALVDINTFTCSPDSVHNMVETIRDEGLTRVVVGSCSPRTHEAVFEAAAARAGLNPALVAMANIREQAAWVHKNEQARATEKGLKLVAAALGRVLASHPVERISVPTERRALVVGEGEAAGVAALALARGGLATLWAAGSEGPGLSEDVEHPLLEIVKEGRVKDASGFAGRFKVALEAEGKVRHETFGAVVLAPENVRYEPRGSFLRGEDDRVLTSPELGARLGDESFLGGLGRVVFIQCVGSRIPERAYCSRDCCRETVEAAIRLKEFDPAIEVVVAYRDMNMRGRLEALYSKARNMGVLFVPFEEGSYPGVERVASNGGTRLRVKIDDQAAGMEVEFDPDVVVLAAASLPSPELKGLSSMFRAALDTDGFLAEAHPKLRPVESQTDGVFLAGPALYPGSSEEMKASALAAAAKALGFLAREEITLGDLRAEARGRCSGCLTCLKVCPAGAIRVSGRMVEVEPAACQGCGICAAECPAGAMIMTRYTTREILAQIEPLLADN